MPSFLVIALFSISLCMFALVLRASKLAASHRIEQWSFRTGLACFFVDGAGMTLVLAMGASVVLIGLSLVMPDTEYLWTLPIVLLLGADIATLFLLRLSALMRRRRPA